MNQPADIQVTILLFAAAKATAGTNELKLTLPQDSTLKEVRAGILDQVPQLEPLLAQSRLAIGDQYQSENTMITEACEIAVIPPVSGG